jgi:hypothetical protein
MEASYGSNDLPVNMPYNGFKPLSTMYVVVQYNQGRFGNAIVNTALEKSQLCTI